MISIFRRTRFYFFLLLFLGAALFTYSLLISPSRSLNSSQEIIFKVTSPFTGFFQKTWDLIHSTFSNYLFLHHTKLENLELKKELVQLKAQFSNAQEQNRQWGLHFQNFQKSDLSFEQAMVAQVISYDPLASPRSILINIGKNVGVQEDAAVLFQGGVVGRVIKVGKDFSQVLLITDPNSFVDVIDTQSRARGMLVGMKKHLALSREHWLTQAEYLWMQQEVRPGDLLVTSGLDQVFPKGLPVGVIKKIERASDGLFYRAEVEPYAEMTKLEEVLVLRK